MFFSDGIYGHIRRNTAKSLLLMAAFAVLIAAYWYAGCLVYSAITLPFSTGFHPKSGADAFNLIDAAARSCALAGWYVPAGIVALWFAIAWTFYKRMIRAATGASCVERRQEPQLYNLVENLAITAGLPMPRVEIMETRALNAYASGLTPGDATIAVSRGLLDALEPAELEAVLAHEMTHIRNRDVRLMVVATIFAGAITFLGDCFNAWRRSRRRRRNYWTVQPDGGAENLAGFGALAMETEGLSAGPTLAGAAVAMLVAGVTLCITHIAAVMVRMGISRSREFMADAGAIELTKNPDALIAALGKISGRDEVPLASESLRALLISSAFDNEDPVEAFFSTHPPIAARIDNLVRYAGGRQTLAKAKPAFMRRAVRSVPTEADVAVGRGPSVAMGFADVGARPVFGRRRAVPA